jgi:hypothetical protein
VEVAVERDEKAIQEAADAAKKAAEEKAAAELDKLRKKLEKAEAAQKKAEEEAKAAADKRADDIRPYEEKAAKAHEEAEALRRKLISAESGANVAAALFSIAQQNFNAAREKVIAMQATHPDVAAKLLAGMEMVLTKILEQVKGAQG